MNDDIIRMAREAGVYPLAMSEEYIGGLERLVALVRADERERIKAANAPVIQRINEHLEKMREDIRARSKV